MVVLMSNSLGSATRIIQMSQLTDELRNTMSMLTRDVRRANYNPYALYCYSNSDCGVDDTTFKVNFIDDLDNVAWQGNNCLRYFLEREVNADGTPGDVGGGGFRRRITDGVGSIEMWTGTAAPPEDCTGDDWIPVTDPGLVDITAFEVHEDNDDPDVNSFSEKLYRSDGTEMLTLRVRQVRIEIQGELILDNSITRRIEDVVKVRNDFIRSS